MNVKTWGLSLLILSSSADATAMDTKYSTTVLNTRNNLSLVLNEEKQLSQAAKNIIQDLQQLGKDVGVAGKIILNKFTNWIEKKYDSLTPEKQQKVDIFVEKLKQLAKAGKLKAGELKAKIEDFLKNMKDSDIDTGKRNGNIV